VEPFCCDRPVLTCAFVVGAQHTRSPLRGKIEDELCETSRARVERHFGILRGDVHATKAGKDGKAEANEAGKILTVKKGAAAADL
jgi:hypothetical protein